MDGVEARVLRLAPTERVPPVVEALTNRATGRCPGADRSRLREPEAKGPRLSGRELESGRLPQIGGEAVGRLGEARLGWRQLVQELDDELVVRERRRVAGERVVRPVPGVEQRDG